MDMSRMAVFPGMRMFTDSCSYVDQAHAQSMNLISTDPNDGSVKIGVDTDPTNFYDATADYYNINGVGRPSVRLTSKATYNHGLFIADIANMPGGVCGTWPAFWTLGDGTWPYHGEIDILEGANNMNTALSSLHTGSQCSITASAQTEVGNLQSTNCTYDTATGANSAGCGVSNPSTASYGEAFNTNGGGVYAMEWTSAHINIWFFPRGAIPQDITAGMPTPASWGLPTSSFQGACDIDSNFINHQIVIDNTFCGDWAGNTWGDLSSADSCAAQTQTSSCAAYVAENPSAFEEM